VASKEEEKSPAKWTPPKCIIVPVVLKMADVDHQVLDSQLENMSQKWKYLKVCLKNVSQVKDHPWE